MRSWPRGSPTRDRHMRMAEVPIEEALGQLRDAVAMSDLWNGDTDLRTEDFARHRALIRARLRRAGLTDDRPSELQVGLAERENLIREFMASSHGRGLSGSLATVDVELLAHHLVDLRSDYEGRPLRWSPTVVSLLLGDLAPRKLLLDADEAANLPAVVRAFVRFSADRSGLPRTFVDETLATVDEVEPEFLARIGDPAAAGPAKAVLAALQARGVDLSDVDAINEAFQQGDPMQAPPGSTEEEASHGRRSGGRGRVRRALSGTWSLGRPRHFLRRRPEAHADRSTHAGRREGARGAARDPGPDRRGIRRPNLQDQVGRGAT